MPLVPVTLSARPVFIPMISVFTTPQSAWQAPVPQPQKPPPPRLAKVDLDILDALRNAGRYGSFVWPLLNEVAVNQCPTHPCRAKGDPNQSLAPARRGNWKSSGLNIGSRAAVDPA